MTGRTVTRARLAEEVVRSTGVTRREADMVVDTVFDSIREALCEGDEVEIRGFGSFRLRRRNARATRNPRTGERVQVPPKQVAFFRAGKLLRTRLNEDAERRRESGAGAGGASITEMFPRGAQPGGDLRSSADDLGRAPLAAMGNEPDS